MKKRGFIDSVRQFKDLADRKHKSYADSVNHLARMYMRAGEESGWTDAESAKERDWAQAFLEREYRPSDADFVFDESI